MNVLRTLDWSPLLISLKTGVVATVICFFLGLFAARRVLKMGGRARAVIDGLLTLPMVLPPTVAGFFLLLIFSLRRPFGAFLYEQAGIKVILDTSGSYLSESLSGCPDMIKPNEDEIEALLGIRVNGYEDVLRSAQELHDTYQIPWVVISLGADGAVLACEEGIFHGKPPVLTPVNTVGCGDSMTGAFAVAMERKMKPEEALGYAVAVSAASAMSPLTGHFDPAVYEKIAGDVVVEVCG